MVKLTPAQSGALDLVQELHEEVVISRRLLKRRIEEEFAKQMDGLLRKRSRAANAAVSAGIPKTRVGRALGTTDWASIQAILALTADEFDPTTRATHDGPWVLHKDEDGTLTGVTFYSWVARSTKEEVVGELHLDLEPSQYGGYDYNFDQMAQADIYIVWLTEAMRQINGEEAA